MIFRACLRLLFVLPLLLSVERVSAADDALGVMVSCPPTWPGIRKFGVKHVTTIPWENYSTPRKEGLAAYKGRKIAPSDGLNLQLACQYERNVWLTIDFPSGILGDCQTDSQGHLACLVEADEDGVLGGMRLHYGEPIIDETLLEGLHITSFDDDIRNIAQRNGFTIKEKVKDDEVIGFTLKRGETIIEVDFGPYGLSKALRTRSVWVSNPRPEMTREEYIRSIIRRFGLNFERLEGEPSVMGWRWRSVDRHEIIVDLKVPEKDGPPIIHMFIP